MGIVKKLSVSAQRRLSNGCLAVGLILWLFVHPAAQWANNASHFASGLLLGVSLAINMGLLWRARRNRHNQA